MYKILETITQKLNLGENINSFLYMKTKFSLDQMSLYIYASYAIKGGYSFKKALEDRGADFKKEGNKYMGDMIDIALDNLKVFDSIPHALHLAGLINGNTLNAIESNPGISEKEMIAIILEKTL